MKDIDYYLKEPLEYLTAVVGYLVFENKVLLGLRKKVSLGLGENLISGIGGKVGDEEAFSGESLEEALIREFKEEIGVEIKEFKKVGKVKFIFPHKPKWNQDVAIFTISSWEKDPQETEAIKPLWFNKNELPKNQMWEDNLYWLPKILKGEDFEGVFLYDEKNKVVEQKIKNSFTN